MATARDLIQASLRVLGIRIPTAQQEADGLTTLNDMLAMWSAERLMVPQVVEEGFTLTAGTAVYTIGTAGTFNTTRPIKIVDAFVRTSDSLDYPVAITMTLEEYNRVTDKATRARPTRLYYATEFPLGKIHLDPKPDAADTLKLFSWKPLTSFATLDTAASLPAEYLKAIRLNLAADLAPEFSVALDSLTVQQAIGAHLTIRNLNRPAVGGARHDAALTRELER